MSRPEYRQVDKEYRQAQLESRNAVLHKTSEADLWMKVIERAINDIILFSLLKEERELTAEEEDLLESAEGFIFDDDYTIPMDDYRIILKCTKCESEWTQYISQVAGAGIKCKACDKESSWKCLKYSILEGQTIQESSFTELLDTFGIENIKGFRKGTRKYIESIIERRKASRQDKDFTLVVEEGKKQQFVFYFDKGDERW